MQSKIFTVSAAYLFNLFVIYLFRQRDCKKKKKKKKFYPWAAHDYFLFHPAGG